MSTVGKWWGRTARNLTSVSWIPSGYVVVGAPAYNPTDGKFYVVLGPASLGSPSTFYIRQMYSSSNTASFTTYATRNIPGNEKQYPFFYGGYLWVTKGKSDKTTWLSKITISDGTETEVAKIYDNGAGDAAWNVTSMAFDGIATVYVMTVFRISSSSYSYNISKYNMQSDTLTSLKTAAIEVSSMALSQHGIGVDATTIFFLWRATDASTHIGSMALDGSGYADLGAHSISILGFRGNALNSNKQIYVQGAQVYTFTDTPLAVWILRDGTDAQLRFVGFFSDGTNVFYEEWDGSTGTAVQKAKGSSLGAVANFICRGIFPFRADLGLESAIGFNIGSNAYWYEAPTKMKEVV